MCSSDMKLIAGTDQIHPHRVNPFITHRHVYRPKLSVHAARYRHPYVTFHLVQSQRFIRTVSTGLVTSSFPPNNFPTVKIPSSNLAKLAQPEN